MKRKKAMRTVLAGVSAVALCSSLPMMAYAQDAQGGADGESDEELALESVVVKGIRGSLKSAQDIKRNADTFVDAISASDIGALPDRSVSEALQRVPGVSVIRFAGPNDPDHFAVEGSGVVIRGLPFVRSELNGRDVFGANAGGVLGFEDVSPELLGSVQVFKNQTADLIEGGIAGTIDLRTRLPFDSDDQVFAFSLEGNYGDLRKQFTPSGSALYSNSWDTDLGRFGFLVNGSYNELKSRADGTQLADFRDPNNLDGTIEGDSPGAVFIPQGIGIRTQDFDRERQSYGAALQWESPDRRIQAAFQFLRSDSTLQWGESVIETVVDGNNPQPDLDQTDFTFDDDGIFTSGTINDSSQWRGPNGTAVSLNPEGGQQLALFRERREEDVTNDYGFNLKFAPTENLRFNLDAQYIDSSADIVDVTVHSSFFAPVRVTENGSIPDVTFILPDEGVNPNNTFVRSFLDHTTVNDADEISFRADVEYDFSNDGWLKSVRAGARFANQETLIRESDFNWGNVSEVWTGRDLDPTLDGTQSVLLLSNPAISQFFGGEGFENFQGRSNDVIGLGAGVPIYRGPGADDLIGFQNAVNALFDAGGGSSPSGATVLSGRDGVIPGTQFLPSEIGSVERDNFAAYTRFDFGFDRFLGSNFALDGNIGIRYVRTSRDVDTSITVDSFDQTFPTFNLCDPDVRAAMETPGNLIDIPAICGVDDATLQDIQDFFGDGFFVEGRQSLSYDEWLPSLNLKLDIGNEQLIRFAVSRSLSRPNVDDLNQFVSINTQSPIDAGLDADGRTISVFNGFQGNQTGNALLLPQTSVNFDVSWEWYFAETGSLTVSGFHKIINDFIIPAGVPIEATNNDATLVVARNAPINGDENSTLSGFEIAYQQFYDFLPGPFDGLGTQFNYAFIDANGVPDLIDPALDVDDPIQPRFDIDRGIFARVSRHNINAIGLYEKGPYQARVAYNWRSEFQVTPRDVIDPFASIYQPATGQLDASFFYDISDNWKVGVQGVNLLDDVTETTQSVVDGREVRAPRSFFTNDRRFSVILRASF
ncbi:MAG: TonB-dependent receptor [Hyphomonadaceae bacterium]